MKRRSASLCVGALLVIASLVIQTQTVTAQTITLKAISAWPKTTVEYKAFSIFTDLVEQTVAKKCPGELSIKYLGGPDVVKAVDQVQALQRGMIDMVFIASAYYTNVLGEIDALKQSDYTPSEERANGAWAYLNNLHEKKLDIHYLARLGLGTKHQLYLKRPIESANLKGFNIRVSPVHIQVVKGLEGNPVVIAIPEVYVALERNVVDGFCFPSVGIRDYGWQKQVKYIVGPPFYTVPNPLLVNLKVWNGMPQEMRDLLTEVGIEAEKRVVAMFDDLAREERSILLKEGLQIIDLPAEEKAKFLRVAFEEGWKEILQRNPQTGPELKRMLTKGK